jgi:hypothetical protein
MATSNTVSQHCQYRQSTYKHNIEVSLCNRCCSGQAINTTYEHAFVQYGFLKKLLNIKRVFLHNISLKHFSFQEKLSEILS